MLEGAFYGLDLLKLHSVTTKLVGRVDKLEEVRKSPVLLLFFAGGPQRIEPFTFFLLITAIAITPSIATNGPIYPK